MKKFVFASVIFVGSLGATGWAQDCTSGVCRMPVRNAVASVGSALKNVAQVPVEVVKDVAQLPVATVKFAACATKNTVVRTRGFLARVRGVFR